MGFTDGEVIDTQGPVRLRIVPDDNPESLSQALADGSAGNGS